MEFLNIDQARKESRRFELELPGYERRQYGQFFTGLRLGRVLAALSCNEQHRRILDPMLGTGDLLDAAYERAMIIGCHDLELIGVEIVPSVADIATRRLNSLRKEHCKPTIEIHCDDVFTPATAAIISEKPVDLIITNPPFVRYQMHAAEIMDSLKENLINISDIVPNRERHLWHDLISSISGLSDLSVPSWLLCGMLLRDGGRIAIVAPETWQNRDYGYPIRSMLTLFFDVEVIVESVGRNWFPDALVRTNLVIAQRKTHRNTQNRKTTLLEISPEAGTHESIVGKAFPGVNPEGALSTWLTASSKHDRIGLVSRDLLFDNYLGGMQLSSPKASVSLNSHSSDLSLPYQLVSILPSDDNTTFVPFSTLPVSIGQGLRTGCNAFFYVQHLEKTRPGWNRIRTNTEMNSIELEVPDCALLPVVHRQSELIGHIVDPEMLHTRVLDLRNYVHPEDEHLVLQFKNLYVGSEQSLPCIMPHDLAHLITSASSTIVKRSGDIKRIPDLSAVRTNTRLPNLHSKKLMSPRFWYMLPNFTDRHLPDTFVPRVNHEIANVYINSNPKVIIDANFITIWSAAKAWTKQAIFTFLSSSWARTCMELVGTPMGGGSLKLEATQLRRLPVPFLKNHHLKTLHQIGQELTVKIPSPALQNRIDAVLFDALCPNLIWRDDDITNIAAKLNSVREESQMKRHSK